MPHTYDLAGTYAGTCSGTKSGYFAADPDDFSTHHRPVVRRQRHLAALMAAMLAVAVAPVPIALAADPVASDRSAIVLEDGSVSITLTATDPDDEDLTFAIADFPDHGALGPPSPADCSQSEVCTVSATYTPFADFNGPDDFTFTADDGVGLPGVGLVTITVTSVNDAPSFTRGGDQAVAEDAGAQSVPNWATDMSPGPDDESGQTLSFSATNTNTTLFSVQPSVSLGGTLAYTPAANASGSATITLTLTDTGGTANGGLNASSETFSISVGALNDGPDAVDDVAIVAEDAVATAIPVRSNDTDVDAGDTLLIETSSDPPHGTVVVTGGGTGLTYKPDANYNGPDSFTYTISDGLLTDSATVDVTVTSVNDAPSFTKGGDQAVAEDAGAQSVPNWATDMSPGPDDESGQTLSFSATNTNTTLFSVQPSVSLGGTLAYTPAANASGSATITLTLTDTGGTANGGLNASSETFSISVSALNDGPDAVDDVAIVAEDAVATAIPVRSNDTDVDAGDTLLIETSSDPPHGTVVVTGGGTGLTYKPDANYNGPDSFTYTISDGLLTDSATVDVTVTSVNDAPVADDEAQTVAEDATATAIDVLLGDTDVDGDTLHVVSTSDPPHGTVAITGGGTGLTYQPDADYNGADSFTYTINDGHAGGDAALVAVTVTSVNDAPAYTAGADQSQPEVTSATARTVAGWATGMSPGPTNEGGQTLTFTTSNNATSLFAVQPAVNSATGNLTYTQAANRSGVATVTVTLTDSGGTANGGVNASSHQFTITIQGTNNTPSAGNDAVSIPEGAAATAIPVLSNDSDLDVGDVLTIDRVTCGAATSTTSCSTTGGVVTITGGGSGLTFKPTALFDGVATFGYRVNDGHDATDTATVLVTVTEDTLAPVMPSGPTAQIYTATTLGASTVKVRISWPSTTDAGSGIEKYHLQRRVNGGGWATVGTASPQSLLVAQNMTTWSTYEYRVRAKDREGNIGPWAYSTSFQPVRYQETSSSLMFVPPWTKAASSGASGGSVRYTYVAGHDMTFAFTGKAVAWVAPKSSARGSVDVTVDAVGIGRFSQRHSPTLARQTIVARSFPAGGAHTLALESAGGGRVDVDCIVILR